MCSLSKNLLAFDLLRFVLQGQIYLLHEVSLDSILLMASLCGVYFLALHWHVSLNLNI